MAILELFNPGYYFSFDPSTIPGLQLWLSTRYPASMLQERSSATTLASANGDPVGTWQDLSGNARHATASTDARRPTIAANAKNGQPGILFDGSDDCIVTPSFAHFPSKRGAIFTVSKRPAAQGAILATFNTGTAPGFVLYPAVIANQTKWYDNGGNRTVTTADPVNECIHSIVRTEDVSLGIWRNGTSVSLNAFTDNQPANNPLTIGASSAPSNFLNANIYEILIYHGTLSTEQRLYIERGLGAAYGITVS